MKSKYSMPNFGLRIRRLIGFNCYSKSKQRIARGIMLVGFVCFWVWFIVFYIPEAKNNVIALESEADLSNGTNHWSIGHGWKYYASPKDSPFLAVLGEDVNGFWAWTPEDTSSSLGHDWIQLEDFQRSTTSMDPVLLGIRLLVQGNTKVQLAFGKKGKHKQEIKYIESSIGDSEESITKAQLCVELLAPQINRGRINSITIGPYLPKDSSSTPESTDLIIIDKILITTGELNTDKQLMYTLFPNGWCSNSKHFLKHLYS